MSTTPQANKPAPGQPGTGLKAYRPTEGYRTRLACFLVVSLIALYAGYQWYNAWPDLVVLVASAGMAFVHSWYDTLPTGWHLGIGAVGGLFWTTYGLFLGYKYVYVNIPSVDFLIKTDMELHKVYWPKVKPWFDASAEAWNATYVVMACVAILALFIFGTDWVFWSLAKLLIYRSA
ncbi:MAG: preprotein translocase subunit SecE [Planctomycetota bacterium]